MASFERDVSTSETEAGETGVISLLSLADDDPYRATSGDPAAAKGRSRTRWGLAGAMLATVAAIGAVVVPSGGDDSQLATVDDETAAGEAPATSAPTPLLGYGSEATSTTAAGSSSTGVTQAAASTADPSASSEATGAGSTSTPSSSSRSTVGGTGGSTATTARATSSSTAKPTSSTAAPTSTAPPSSTAGGCWNLVVQDDFDGSSIDGSTWIEYNGEGNGGHGRRSSSALSVSGGLLTITASMQDGTLVSGGMGGRHNQTYGRYEVRVRTDQDPSESTSGLVLTWPQSGASDADGQHDVYLTRQAPGDRHEFYSVTHKPGGAAGEDHTTVHAASASEWHTVVMEWRADKLVISRDGQVVETLSEDGTNRIPDAAQFVAIQLDAWNDTIPGPVAMQVDYVKIYEAC